MRQHKRTVSEGKNCRNKQHFKYDKDGRYEIIIEERNLTKNGMREKSHQHFVIPKVLCIKKW